MLSQKGIFADPEPNTLLYEGRTRARGYVQLPKLVLYARNLSRDAKLLYIVLLGYAWQEQRCFPGYMRLCTDMDASENMVRKYMRELESVHLLSQRRRGQGKTNIYILHDLRTAKIEVQDHHKIAILEPQESYDYEETEEIKTEEIKNRTIGERSVIKARENAENDEKALGGGEPAVLATIAPASPQGPSTHQRRASTEGKQTEEPEAAPRDQAPAQARNVAGSAIEEQLRALGGSNPAGGAQTILEALVDAQAPVEVISDLMSVGMQRLEHQQKLSYIANPTGYVIGILRELAVEAWLKGWDVARIRAEDQEKQAQALCRVAHAGKSLPPSDEAAGLVEEIPPTPVDQALAAAPAPAAPPLRVGMADEEGQPEAASTAGQPQRCLVDEAAPHQTCPPNEREEAPRQRTRLGAYHAKQVWQSTLERIQSKISPATFSTWFTGTRGVALEDQRLMVGVRNTFSRTHLENRFYDLICSVLYDLVGPAAEVQFEVMSPEED